MKKYIAVIGPSNCTPEEFEDAYTVGAKLAGAGAVLICGGRQRCNGGRSKRR